MLARFAEVFQAWRRGDKRVAPHGSRGRVYERPGEGGVKAKARPEAKMTVRVFRAEENVWYRQNAKTGAWERE